MEWGVSGGINKYEEPDLMQLKGPELGLHARVLGINPMPNGRLETDILLGTQSYSSSASGSMNGVTNLETRWRGLVPVINGDANHSRFFSGLAVHTLWNDLRGTTSTQARGYQRSAVQLWLPVRWSNGNLWELDAGLLIYGRHTSKLSEANSNYSDIVNTQRRGHYAQFVRRIGLDNGGAVKPFVRYTHLANSDIVVMNNVGWIEPHSNRWQVGAIWEFGSH